MKNNNNSVQMKKTKKTSDGIFSALSDFIQLAFMNANNQNNI